MQRNMDLVRDLLFMIEEECTEEIEDIFPSVDNEWLEQRQDEDEKFRLLSYHIGIMEQAGLVTGNRTAGSDFDYWSKVHLSWSGHDFLDSIRDNDVWENTKKTVSHVGSFRIDIVKKIATGFVKQKIKRHTGIEI